MIRIADIQRIVADHYGIPCEMMRAPDRVGTRLRKFARPRQVAMFLAREMTPHSTVMIGQRFGGRDHSTVCTNTQAIQRFCADDVSFSGEVAWLGATISVESKKQRFSPVFGDVQQVRPPVIHSSATSVPLDAQPALAA